MLVLEFVLVLVYHRWFCRSFLASCCVLSVLTSLSRVTVYETEKWAYHQWTDDCRVAEWTAPLSGASVVGRQILFVAVRGPLSPGRDAAGKYS